MAMTRQTKKNVDALLPTLGCIAITYYYWKKTGGKDMRTLLGVLVISWLLIYVLTSQITKRIYEHIPQDEVPSDLGTPGSSTANYDPRPVTDELYEDIYSSWYVKRNKSIYERLLALGNGPFVMVSNDWKARYYTMDHETLRQAIGNEEHGQYWDAAFNSLVSSIEARFAALKID